MKLAVVTGATQGIGKSIAEKFLKENFAVAVCARTEKDLIQLRNEWKERFPGTTSLIIQADVSKKPEIENFANAVLEKFKTVDVLINNAGAFYPGKLMEEPEGHLESLMETNLYSAYYLTRALITRMRQTHYAHIFNISSVAAIRAYENGGAYSITKYALSGFSHNLRMELMEHDIKVTTVVPGATWSRSWQQSGLNENRFIRTEDIAEMVFAAYQLSPSANVDEIVIRPLKGDI